MRNALRFLTLGASAVALCIAAPALADPAEQAQIQALQAQMQALQAQVNSLSQALAKAQSAAPAPAPTPAPLARQTNRPGSFVPSRAVDPAARPPSPATLETSSVASAANAGPPSYSHEHGYMERKPGKSLTFYTPGGEITAYGNFDVSVDYATKGIAHLQAGGAGPVGRMGWQPDISTNMSFLGVRGFQEIPGIMAQTPQA